MKIYLNNSHEIVATPKRKSDGEPIEGATMTAQLLEPHGEPVAGSTVSLSEESEGKYTGTMDVASLPIKRDGLYDLKVSGTWSGGAIEGWIEGIVGARLIVGNGEGCNC